MNYRSLISAGRIAMASAFIAIPFSYLAFKLESSTDSSAVAMQAGMQLFGTLLFVVLTGYTRKLLNGMCQFHLTDRPLNLMIMTNVAAGGTMIAGLLYPPYRELLGSAALLLMIGEGVCQIRFGYQLLKLPHNFGGLLKPFCYANIATGVCVASVLLIIPGVIVSAISDLMLGTIFLNLAKLVREAELSTARSDGDS